MERRTPGHVQLQLQSLYSAPGSLLSRSDLCHTHSRRLKFKEGKGFERGHRTSKRLTLAQNSGYLTTKPCALSAALPPVASHPRAATVPAPLTPNRGLSVTK